MLQVDDPVLTPDHPVGRLTASELRVLELVALGLSSKQVAARLWVSRQAVTYQIGNLLGKLRARTRTGLVARAYALGVLEPGVWPPRVAEPDAPNLKVIRGARSD
jgi:DNA-binding CsgD family transcriptional regulator